MAVKELTSTHQNTCGSVVRTSHAAELREQTERSLLSSTTILCLRHIDDQRLLKVVYFNVVSLKYVSLVCIFNVTFLVVAS